MKSIYKIFSGMGVTFRDESNEPNSTIIGYSDATVTTANHTLIVRQKPHLLQYHNYGGVFIIRFYLILVISDQNAEKFS